MKKLIFMVVFAACYSQAHFGEALGGLFQTSINSSKNNHTYRPAPSSSYQSAEREYSCKRRLLFLFLCCLPRK